VSRNFVCDVKIMIFLTRTKNCLFCDYCATQRVNVSAASERLIFLDEMHTFLIAILIRQFEIDQNTTQLSVIE
jgi:hypothetical protein